jgi:FHS family Na+ dependent glucose MFS transporter 1
MLWPEAAPALWVGTLLMGFFMASAFPTALSLAERNLNITAAVTSAFFVGASLGGMIVPWIIGQRFEVVGPQVTLSILLVDLLAAIAIFGGTLLWARRD